MTIRLLIADDDRGITGMLRASCERHGFEVDVAADGAEAVQRFQQQRYDVVLLDMRMPRTDGLKAVLELRTSPRGNLVGIAVMTATPPSEEERARLEQRAHIDAWFSKPFALRDLRERLAEIAFRYTGATPESEPAGVRSEPLVAPASTPRVRRVATERVSAPAALRPSGAAGVAIGRVAVRTVEVRTPPVVASAETRVVAPVDGEPRGAHAWELFESEAPISIEGPRTAPRALLALARGRRSGTLTLRQRRTEVQLMFLRGVLVGAVDNVLENRLGERLLRKGLLRQEDLREVLARMEERGERFAEATLGLGLCDAEALLHALYEQARERAIRAMGLDEGELSFRAHAPDVDAPSGEPIDPFDVILSWFLRAGDDERVRAFYALHRRTRLETTPDLEAGLLAFAQAAPASKLPMALFAAPLTLDEALDRAAQGGERPPCSHVYAMWMAGMIRLESDPPPDPRPVPRRQPAAEIARELVDREAIARVRGEWLRAQGRRYYDVLDVPPDAPAEVLAHRIEAYKVRWGRAAFDARRLGPAASVATELWELIDDMEAVLTDASQRAAYDAVWEETREGALERRIDADAALLEGKLALRTGALEEARDAFTRAREAAPDDVDVDAYLAWSEVLIAHAAAEAALSRLQEASRAAPGAARPLLFLGLAAKLRGDLAAARAYLREAWRRCPDDPEVREALRSLQVEPGEG